MRVCLVNPFKESIYFWTIIVLFCNFQELRCNFDLAFSDKEIRVLTVAFGNRGSLLRSHYYIWRI